MVVVRGNTVLQDEGVKSPLPVLVDVLEVNKILEESLKFILVSSLLSKGLYKLLCC